MHDDEWRYEPYEIVDEYEEAAAPSRTRSCLFLGITFLLIASLLGSSALAYFLLVRQQRRSTPPRSDTQQALVEPLPTAAPATVVAAVAALEPAAEPATNAIQPEVNRIAIVNREGQIETMSPRGEERRVLTLLSDNADYQFPAWAPDSQRIAIIANRVSGSGIYVFDDDARTGALDEHEVYFSAARAPIYLYWSPDSENLAFLNNQSRNLLGLNVVDRDGEMASRLLATGSPFYWDWSGDGRQLLIHSGQNSADNTLALIGLDGNAQADNLATPGAFQAPGIGGGGRYLAFAEQAGAGLSALVVIDTSTGERKTFDETGSLVFNWSPTEDKLAFTHSAVNNHPFWGPLRVLDVTTGEQQVISTRTVLAFFWSPDGRQIAFITLNNGRDDGGINAWAPAKERHLGRVATAPVAQPRQGFLTLSVVDVATGQGLRLLDFEPTRLYLSQFLPFFDQYALSHRVWSPDSSAIVLPVREDGVNTIQIVPTRGGRRYLLAEGVMAFWSHK